jgi:hypothetical protein
VPGVSWWYNRGTQAASTVPTDYASLYGVDYIPMPWSGASDDVAMTAFLLSRPDSKYLLMMNEPDLVDQANPAAAQAAAQWPDMQRWRPGPVS